MVIKNKRGQDLSIGTLILIVLGIVVLVLLILGFSLGWDNLWKKINIFGGTSSVGDIATACKIAVTSQDQYTFCTKTWEIKNASNDKIVIGCRDRLVTGIDKTAFGNCDGVPYTLDDPSNEDELKTCVLLKTGAHLETDIENCDEQTEDTLNQGFKDSTGNNYCCVPR